MRYTAPYTILKKLKPLLIVLLIVFLGSCSSARYLEEGQRLYTGSHIELDSEEKISGKRDIISELDGVIRPRPNERILFWRARLWMYNVAGEDPQWRPLKWVKNTLGRPPALWQDFDEQRNIRLMENRLFNKGFFDAQIHFTPQERRHKAKAKFDIHLWPAYTISEIVWPDNDHEITRHILDAAEETRLRTGHPYQLDRLREERERITRHLRDQGYFYFNADFLIFRADTTVGNREVKLALAITTGAPNNAFRQYKINEITMNAHHELSVEDETTTTDVVEVTDYFTLKNNNGQFKSATLQRAVFLENRNLYNTRDHDLTLNHLMGLGVFKFVNLRFNELHQRDTAWLDLNILLTPMEKKTLSAELRGVSRSTGFIGPGINLSFSNRNFFRGAEQFNINLEGSYEVLMGRRDRRANSLEAGISSELVIPRFLAPLGIRNISPMFIPKTRISLGFSYLSRTDAFSVSSIRSQFGYEWNHSVAVMHRYNPFVFSIFSLGNISEDYEQFFSREVLFRRGLFEQFLLGSEYSFYYNSQLKSRRKHAWYFNYNIDLSGNLLYAALNMTGLGEEQEDGGYGILNQSFSQYTKTDFDLRYYLDMGHGQRMVSRLAAGIGAPYGNSSTMPYVKLFHTGGSNSIRAFHPRSLGPGSYVSPDTLRTSFDIYQSGEIKLELNVEYRFEISGIIKGALFADAGNIWNIKERENIEGGRFDSSEFLAQVALGTGAGLRFDFTFFILRLDLAFPLAVPYDDSDTYFQEIQFLDGQWRRDNLRLNLAIGYPF